MTLRQDQARQQAAPIECVTERVVYSNRFITLHDDDVRFSDGSLGTYGRLIQSDGQPGVAVLPLAGGAAGLVRVYRYPTGSWEWGVPRGNAHGGDPAVTASEELLEELGARPLSLTMLGRVNPNSGILAGTDYLFAAEYGEQVAAPLDTREVSAVTWVPVPDLLAEIAAGTVTDGYTLAAVCAAMCRGLLATGENFSDERR